MTRDDEPMVDCHVHVLDPARFPYAADTFYRPAGHEIGPAAQLARVMDAHGVRHALLVGPNSGYGEDNRCMLDAVATSNGRFKGVAVVRNDIGRDELARLKSAGVVGVAYNIALLGVDYYANTASLLAHLAALDMFVNVQVQDDQMVDVAPLLVNSGAKIVIDHCGRPAIERGVDQPGFRAVVDLARTRRAAVKLSGYVKFSREPHPYADAQPFVRALLDAFGPDACLWASDWPFMRAPYRIDYGPLIELAAELLPDAAVRRAVMWETPRRLFGFASPGPVKRP
jgi:predicted TIM-barrel fold metal-dependent hydrolase